MELSPKYTKRKIVVEGIPRLVGLPLDSDDLDVSEGIPLDAYNQLEPLFEGASTEFWKTLINAFWERDLITPLDFLNPSAHKKIRQALNTALKHDTLSILAVLREKKNE